VTKVTYSYEGSDFVFLICVYQFQFPRLYCWSDMFCLFDYMFW